MLRRAAKLRSTEKSQKQAGGKAPERRRPLWTPSDGNAANGLFWLDFAAKLPCAHSAKREGHRIACTDAASGTLSMPPWVWVDRLAAQQAKRVMARISSTVRSAGALPVLRN